MPRDTVMFVFYHLFHRCVESTPSNGFSLSKPSSDPEKDRAVLIWWAAFGFTLFFRPAVEFVIRVLLFSTCVLLIGTLDGSLNLFVGHAILRAAKHKGYESSLLSSLEAGSLGGIIVIGPTALAAVSLIALLGGPKLESALSRHIALLLELASAIAVSAAGCSVGVRILQSIHLDDGPPLDTAYAARAGTLGACVLTVPIVATAAFFVREAQTIPSARHGPSVSSYSHQVGSPGCPENGLEPPRTRPRRLILAYATGETLAYVVVMLCILSVRLLCM